MVEFKIKNYPTYILVSICFLIAGFLLLLTITLTTFMRYLSAIGFLFFLFIGIATLHQVLRRDHKLLLTSDGFVDTSSNTDLGFVPWQDVDRVELIYHRRRDFIYIKLKDWDSYKKRLNPNGERLAYEAEVQGYTGHLIDMAMFNHYTEEIYEAIIEMRSL